MYQIFSVPEWKALPEISFRAIKDTSADGSTYQVHKVGFLAVTEADCRAADVAASVGPAGKAMLPTAVVDFAGERKLCRLPIELTDWAFECVAMAHAKQLKFPCKVEFGISNGRKYAEFRS